MHEWLARRLVGRIVVLEPLASEHGPGLWHAASDPRIWDYFPVLAASDRRTFRAWIAEALDAAAVGLTVPFATVVAATGDRSARPASRTSAPSTASSRSVRGGESRDSAWYSSLDDEWQATKAELEKRLQRRSVP